MTNVCFSPQISPDETPDGEVNSSVEEQLDITKLLLIDRATHSDLGRGIGTCMYA